MRTLTAKRYPINDPCAGRVDLCRPKMIRTLKLSLCQNPAHGQTVRHCGSLPNPAYSVVFDVLRTTLANRLQFRYERRCEGF